MPKGLLRNEIERLARQVAQAGIPNAQLQPDRAVQAGVQPKIPLRRNQLGAARELQIRLQVSRYSGEAVNEDRDLRLEVGADVGGALHLPGRAEESQAHRRVVENVLRAVHGVP